MVINCWCGVLFQTILYPCLAKLMYRYADFVLQKWDNRKHTVLQLAFFHCGHFSSQKYRPPHYFLKLHLSYCSITIMKQFGDAPKYIFISSRIATHLGPAPLFLADLQGRCPPSCTHWASPILRHLTDGGRHFLFLREWLEISAGPSCLASCPWRNQVQAADRLAFLRPAGALLLCLCSFFLMVPVWPTGLFAWPSP